jgi:hypothetical protein
MGRHRWERSEPDCLEVSRELLADAIGDVA